MPVPVPPHSSSKSSPKSSCSRKSSTTSQGNSCDSSISAARGAIRSRASVADELADLALLLGQDVVRHGAQSTRAESREPIVGGGAMKDFKEFLLRGNLVELAVAA